MTSPKPPEDEAERLAVDMIAPEVWEHNGEPRFNYQDRELVLKGFRAGQAPLLKEIERLKQFEPPRFWKFHDTHEYRDELEKDFKELSDQLTAERARSAALVAAAKRAELILRSLTLSHISMTNHDRFHLADSHLGRPIKDVLHEELSSLQIALSAHAEKSDRDAFDKLMLSVSSYSKKDEKSEKEE